MQKEIDVLKARLSGVNENGLVPPSKQVVAASPRRIVIVDQND
jgi:hypothetical protein